MQAAKAPMPEMLIADDKKEWKGEWLKSQRVLEPKITIWKDGVHKMQGSQDPHSNIAGSTVDGGNTLDNDPNAPKLGSIKWQVTEQSGKVGADVAFSKAMS